MKVQKTKPTLKGYITIGLQCIAIFVIFNLVWFTKSYVNGSKHRTFGIYFPPNKCGKQQCPSVECTVDKSRCGIYDHMEECQQYCGSCQYSRRITILEDGQEKDFLFGYYCQYGFKKSVQNQIQNIVISLTLLINVLIILITLLKCSHRKQNRRIPQQLNNIQTDFSQ